MSQRVAVVTGASRGIGAAIALQLAADGHRVACVASRAENAQATVDQIGEAARAYGVDMGDRQAVTDLIAQIESDMGSIGILVNNAGITRDNLMLRMSDEDWDDVIRVNLTGSFAAIKAVQKGMMKARWGRIVNITSIVGVGGQAGQANYAASKAGIIGVTKSVAKELGRRGITCNAVAPGFIATDMTADLPEEFRTDVEKRAPVGRLGEPEDIAQAVSYLCSEGAGYVTGQTLVVDGGLTL